MVSFSIMYFQIWCSKNGNKNQGISYHCLLAGVVTSASIQTTYTHHANVVIQFLITSKNRYMINAEISRWTKHHLRTLNKENKYEYPSLSTKNINQSQYVRWYLNAKDHFKTVWRINIFQVTIILLYVNFVVCLLVVCSEIEAKKCKWLNFEKDPQVNRIIFFVCWYYSSCNKRIIHYGLFNDDFNI